MIKVDVTTCYNPQESKHKHVRLQCIFLAGSGCENKREIILSDTPMTVLANI